MKLFALLIVFVITCSNAKEISRETLDELEQLLNQFKKSAANSKPEVTQEESRVDEAASKQVEVVGGENVFEHPAKDICASNCRIAMRECMAFSDTHDAKQKCADLFVTCFPKCYFGSLIVSGNPDAFLCHGNCMMAYDQCIFGSKTKPEMFPCFNYRNMCTNHCPIPYSSSAAAKRGCRDDCSAEYTMCSNALHEEFGPGAIYMCIASSHQCKNKC